MIRTAIAYRRSREGFDGTRYPPPPGPWDALKKALDDLAVLNGEIGLSSDSKSPAEKSQNQNIGRQVLNVLADMAATKEIVPEYVWHELIGQQVVSIVESVRE